MKNIIQALLLLLMATTWSTHGQEKAKKNSKKDEPKSYADIITEEAQTDTGLFDVHQIDDKYYYEIPDSLFGREMLIVTRIAKTATGLGFGGGKQNTQVVRWEKKHKKVLVRVASYINQALGTISALLALLPVASVSLGPFGARGEGGAHAWDDAFGAGGFESEESHLLRSCAL